MIAIVDILSFIIFARVFLCVYIIFYEKAFVVSLPSGFVTVLHADKESTNDGTHRGHPGNIT